MECQHLIESKINSQGIKYFQCQKCLETFVQERILSKPKSKITQCGFCQKNVSSSNYKRHVSQMHEGETPKVVNKQSVNHPQNPTRITSSEEKVSKVSDTLETFQEEKRYKCDFCSSMFADQESVKSHQIIKHNQRLKKWFDCKICHQSFKTREGLRRHIKAIHELVKHPCNICNQIFSSRSGLDRHTKSVHDMSKNSFQRVNESARHPCNSCSQSYATKDGLKRHVKTAHEKVKYPCNYCDQLFAFSDTLRRHIRSVHELIRHPCKLCPQVFTHKPGLQRHTESVHERLKFPCSECGQKFHWRSSLKKHVSKTHAKSNKSHSSDVIQKEFPQNTENLTFSKSQNINESVSESVKHPCNSCNLVFAREYGLRRHIKSVHELVKHPCKYCNQLFTLRSGLLRHIRSAHELVRYPCSSCKQQFTSKDSLNRHIKSIHQLVKYPCKNCGLEFARKSRLLKHYNRNHTDQKNPEIFEKSSNKEVENSENLMPSESYEIQESPKNDMKSQTFEDIETPKSAKKKPLEPQPTTKITSVAEEVPKLSDIVQSFEYDEKPKKQDIESIDSKDSLMAIEKVFDSDPQSRNFEADLTIKEDWDKEPLSPKTHCNLCQNQVFEGLKEHCLKAHSNVQCQNCCKMFNERQALELYFEVIYEKLQNFKCVTCRIYDDPKLQCPFCNKKYSTKGNLQTHVQTIHEGLKRFECLKCSLKFGQKINLKTHEKKCHRLNFSKK